MTEPARRRLLLGTVDADGTVDPGPVIVTLAPDGTVAAWSPLAGTHEPHSTIPLRALLSLPDLSILPL